MLFSTPRLENGHKVDRSAAKRAALLSCIVATCWFPLFAEQELSARRVVERYVEAIGGREAQLKIRTRAIRGERRVGEAITGEFEILQKAPNRWLVRMELPEGTWIAASDGTHTWEKSPRGFSHLMDDAAAADAAREWELHRDIRFGYFYAELILHGTTHWEGRECYLVEGKVTTGRNVWFFFDVATGLLLRREIREDSAEGPRITSVEYSAHRLVDGVLLPHLIHRSGPDGEWWLQVTDVRHNLDIPDARFRQREAY